MKKLLIILITAFIACSKDEAENEIWGSSKTYTEVYTETKELSVVVSKYIESNELLKSSYSSNVMRNLISMENITADTLESGSIKISIDRTFEISNAEWKLEKFKDVEVYEILECREYKK